MNKEYIKFTKKLWKILIRKDISIANFNGKIYTQGLKKELEKNKDS